MNKKFLPVIGIVVLVVIAGLMYQKWGSTPTEQLQAGEVSMTGTIVCLPHKGSGPSTTECAYGLQTVDGKYYSLVHLWDVAPDLNETQAKAEIIGVLSAPAADEKYDIAGVLDVHSGKEVK